MSTEQLLRNSSNEAFKEDQTQVSNKVDINILLEKVRAEKKKERKKFNFFKSNLLSNINHSIYCFDLN